MHECQHSLAAWPTCKKRVDQARQYFTATQTGCLTSLKVLYNVRQIIEHAVRNVMARSEFKLLHKHKLIHIRTLKVDPVVFEAVFSRGCCSTQKCNASCCEGGVMVDLEERNTILRRADLIRKHMDVDQVQDAAGWFDEEVGADEDYPTGQATGTQTNEKGCVFLKNEGLCVLQVAAEAEGLSKHALKPFYCFAFPVTIKSGVLTIDDPDFMKSPASCSMNQGGMQSALDVCFAEFEFVLGCDGYTELKELATHQAWQSSTDQST